MIPYATTTIDVTRQVEAEDGYDESTESAIATGVRAVIWEPSGDAVATASGVVSTTTRKMNCDMTPIRAGDVITTGDVQFVVQSVTQVFGPLEHTTAILESREY
jgi:isopentenyl phosphate kinase